MKKLIMLGCILAIITSGCSSGGSSGGGVPVDNTRLSGDWSYVWMLGGSFITTRGIATFNGDGTATYDEQEVSTGGAPDSGTFNYTAYTNNQIVFEEFVGTLSNDGNFFVATDTNSTIADPEVMMMVAVKQPTTADNSFFSGIYYSGVFANTAAGTNSTTFVTRSVADGTDPGGSLNPRDEIAPTAQALPTRGYETIADGTTVIDDTPGVGGTATGQVGIISADGNLFISADADVTNPFLVMSIKGSAKTNTDLFGTYVVHQFMDDAIGTGTGFITTMSEATFNGDDDGFGLGTGTYTEIASSTGIIGAPNQPFTYFVDEVTNPGTFVLDPGPDQTYGVMSPDASVLGFVDVNTGLPGDTTVFLMIAVKK